MLVKIVLHTCTSDLRSFSVSISSEMKQRGTFCGFIFVLLLVTSTHLEGVLGEDVTCSGDSDSDIYTGNRRCESGWKYMQGTQRGVCIKIFEKRNFDDAVKTCKDRDGDILGDLQALKQCFDGISHPDVNAIWRSRTRKKKECQVWNVGNEARRKIPCDMKRYFLCGKTPSAPSTKTAMTTIATEMIFATTIKDSLCPSSDSSKCSEGWLDVGFGKCLMIRPMRLQRWHDANKECKSKGAELLTELEMTALFKAVIACKDKVKITIPMRQSVWIQGCKRTEFPGLQVVSNDADPCSAENVLLVVCIASVGDRVTALKESDVQGFFSSLDGSRQESLDMAETDFDPELIRRPDERLITRMPDVYREKSNGAAPLIPSQSSTRRRKRTTTPMTTTTTMTVWVTKTKDSSCPIPDISRCSKGWLDVGLGICLLIRPVPEGLKHGEQANRECTKMNAGLLNEVQIASLFQTVLACKDKVNFPITMKQSVWLQGCKSIGFQGLKAVFHDPCTTQDVWLLVCAANVGDNVTALPESDLQSPLSSLGGSQRESVDLAETDFDPDLVRHPYEGLSTRVSDVHRENSDGAFLVPSPSSTRRRKRTTTTMATTTIMVTTTKQDYSCPVSNSSDCSEGWLHVGRGICLMLMNKPSGLETLEQANQECEEMHARLFDEKEITQLFQTMIGCQDKLAIPIPVDLIDIKPRVWLQEGCKKFEIQASTVVSNGPCTTQDGHLLVCAANVGDNVPAIPEFDLLRFLSPGGGSRTMSVELPWFDINLKFEVPSFFNPVVDLFDSQEDDLDVVQPTTTSTTTSTTTLMTTTTEELCPDLDNDLCPDENWLNVGTGKCLHAHPMPTRTWEEARKQCERLNAHLLTSEELALIQPTCFKKLSKRNGIPSLFLRERSVWIDGCKRVRLSWPEMIVDEICLSRDVKFLLCAVDDSISANSRKEPLSETSSETSQKNIESAQENPETGKHQQVAETATVMGIPVVVIPVVIIIIIIVDIMAIVIYRNRDRLKRQFGLLPVSDHRNLKNAEEGNIDPDLNDSGGGEAKNEDDQGEDKSSDGNKAEKNTNEARVEKSGEEVGEAAKCGDEERQTAPSEEKGEEKASDGKEEKTVKDKEDMKSGDEAEGESSGEKKEEKTGEEKGEEKPDSGKEDTSGDGKGERKSGDEKEGEETLDKDAGEKSEVSNTEEKSGEKDLKASDGEKEGEKTGAEKEEKEISSENDGEKSDEGKGEGSAG